ncbi:hypothetical protein EGW08_007407, partial [Elysia chlorotica]
GSKAVATAAISRLLSERKLLSHNPAHNKAYLDLCLDLLFALNSIFVCNIIPSSSDLPLHYVFIMCGRTACALAPDEVVRACSYKDRHGKRKKPSWVDAPGGQKYTPAYNVAPGCFTPVLLSGKHLSTRTAQLDGQSLHGIPDRVVMPMKWGLVPPWHQGDPNKVPYETNNCRAEGMLEKKTFKVPLMRGNRCVILAEGFFEWKTSKDGKQPYYFYFSQNHLKSSPVKNEVYTLPSDKMVKSEKIGSTEQTYKDRKPLNPDLLLNNPSNKVQLRTADFKSSPFSPENNNTTSKSFHQVKKEVELTSNTIKSECFSERGSYDESSRNIEITSISEKRLTDQSYCEVSRTDDTDIDSIKERECEEGESLSTACDGQRLLTMAGVFDVWKADENAPPLYSYSVITVSSSQDMDWCHHRMPAILSTEEEVQNWLDFSSLPLSKATSLIKPKVCLTHHAVSKQVNNSRYQAADSVKPVQVGKQIATPGSKFMQQWLQSASPVKRKWQDSSLMSSAQACGKSSQASMLKKKKEKREDSPMMKWLKSGSPLKKM